MSVSNRPDEKRTTRKTDSDSFGGLIFRRTNPGQTSNKRRTNTEQETTHFTRFAWAFRIMQNWHCKFRT